MVSKTSGPFQTVMDGLKGSLQLYDLELGLGLKAQTV